MSMRPKRSTTRCAKGVDLAQVLLVAHPLRGAPALVVDLRRGGQRGQRAARAACDGGALLEQAPHDGRAHAAARARDDRHLAVELAHACPASLSSCEPDR